jgi:hypothetical protein
MELYIKQGNEFIPIAKADIIPKGKLIWQVGSDKYIPTQKQLEEFVNILKDAKLFGGIVTHSLIKLRTISIDKGKQYIITVGNKKFIPTKKQIQEVKKLFESFFPKGIKFEVVPYGINIKAK